MVLLLNMVKFVLKLLAGLHLKTKKSNTCNEFVYVDMERMYLKQTKIQIGFAPPVVESATAVCAGKLKVGLPLVLYIERYKLIQAYITCTTLEILS